MEDHSNLFVPQGHLILGFGPMGGGKSQYLRKELTRMADIGMRVLYVCHSADKMRDSDDGVSTDGFMSSHESSFNGLSSKIRKIRTPLLSLVNVNDYDAIGVDEGAFFQTIYPLYGKEAEYYGRNYISDIEKTVTHWIEEKNKRVIVVSLAGDYKRKKFGYITDLIPMTNKIEWFDACCTDCIREMKKLGFHGDIINRHGSFSARLTESKAQNVVGTLKDYAPMCRNHIREYNILMGFERDPNNKEVSSNNGEERKELTVNTPLSEVSVQV